MCDSSMRYGLCAEYLIWMSRPDVFAREVQWRVKLAGDLFADLSSADFLNKTLESSLSVICDVIGQSNWQTLSTRCLELSELSKSPWNNRVRIHEMMVSMRSVYMFLASTSGEVQNTKEQKFARFMFLQNFHSVAGVPQEAGLMFLEALSQLPRHSCRGLSRNV